MNRATIPAILLAISALSLGVFGQGPTASATQPSVRIFPLSEIKEGMHGTARTVFRGNRSEEFSVEILGVLPNMIGPKQDMIVGRLSGALAERTFVFAGMSGSPLYIDGKLVGAISYSFPFAKEPICGITPIEQMMSTVVNSAVAENKSKTPVAFLYSDLLSNTWRPAFAGASMDQSPLVSGFPSDSRLMAVAGQTFVPIATPIAISGLSQQTIDSFATDLKHIGILPVAASGANNGVAPMKKATASTLVGGDSVVVHLARGDIQIAAGGTVTLRDGNKIYAFGHPFFSLGSTDLPMAESHVVTVVPSSNNSFKLFVPDDTVGSMTQDRATGIFGELDEAPKMIPVRVRLTTSRGRSVEVNFESVTDEFLTPLIVNAGVSNALNAHERGVGESTIELRGTINIKGEEPIRINRRFAGQQAAAFAASASVIPLAALLRASFDGTEVTGIDLDLSATDGSKTAALERISIDRNQVRPGDTVEVTAFARTEAGKTFIQKVPITIPKDAAPGTLSITVGDGNAVQQNSAVTQFVPKTAAQLISTVNRLKRPDRLYAVLSRTTTGAIVGVSEMPNLPPSMLATINNDRTAGGSKPEIQTILSESELMPLEFIVSGQQTLSIEVIR